MTLSTETASTDLKTIFYKKDYISQGPNGQVKRVVLTADEASALLKKHARNRWFLVIWMGNGDVPSIPKCIVERVFCPGSGSKTTTTYEVVEVQDAHMAVWHGETEFTGTLVEQVYHSPGRWGGEFRYEDPFINPKAPQWLQEIGIELGRKQWRMDFDKRFSKEVAV